MLARTAAKALGGAFAGLTLLASAVSAAPLRHDWQAALLAPSLQLRLFALETDHPRGAAAPEAALRTALGLRQPAHSRPQLITHRQFLLPTISYDGNVNGGFPGRTLTIGGLPFTVDQPYRAKHGVLVGLRAGVSARWVMAPGMTLSGAAVGSAARAPRLGLDAYSAHTRLCATKTRRRLNWLSGCLGTEMAEKQLSSTHARYLSLQYGRVFSNSFGLGQTVITLRRNLHDGWAKNQVVLTGMVARRRFGVIQLSLDTGQWVSGQNTEIYGAGLSLTRPVFGHVTVLSLRYGYAAGSEMFGMPRHDQTYTLGASFGLGHGVRANLSLTRTRSTIAAYSGTLIGFGFDLTRRAFGDP